MRLGTKAVRNLTFVGMLAALSLARGPAGANQDCGPYYCPTMCAPTGGYFYYQACSACYGAGCQGIGENCFAVCVACAGDPEYTCYPLGG